MPWKYCALYALLLLLLSLRTKSDTNTASFSLSFEIPDLGFTCPSVPCPQHRIGSNISTLPTNVLQDGYYHMIVGLENPTNFNLLIWRVCEGFQLCIPPQNFLLILHGPSQQQPTPSEQSNESDAAKESAALREYAMTTKRVVAFLEDRGISINLWHGEFSSDAKMEQAYALLKGKVDNNKIIYHTDIDEITDAKDLEEALKELGSGSCDYVRGSWSERLSRTGSLNKVELTSPLKLQYPLRCKVSDNVVGGGMTKKTVLYRANLRVDGGGHEVWCDRSLASANSRVNSLVINNKMRKNMRKKKKRRIIGDEGKGGGLRGATTTGDSSEQRRRLMVSEKYNLWNMTKACSKHIYDRGKSKYTDYILSQLPIITRQPRLCHTSVNIDHYKFIHGIEDYLRKRVVIYQKQGKHWWRDSFKFLMHLQKYNGSICVDCHANKCVDTLTNELVSTNKDKSFI